MKWGGFVWFVQVKAVAEDMNLGFLGMGFNPMNELHQVPIMPKVRKERGD